MILFLSKIYNYEMHKCMLLTFLWFRQLFAQGEKIDTTVMAG